jgi:hypothetical protein
MRFRDDPLSADSYSSVTASEDGTAGACPLACTSGTVGDIRFLLITAIVYGHLRRSVHAAFSMAREYCRLLPFSAKAPRCCPPGTPPTRQRPRGSRTRTRPRIFLYAANGRQKREIRTPDLLVRSEKIGPSAYNRKQQNPEKHCARPSPQLLCLLAFGSPSRTENGQFWRKSGRFECGPGCV